MLREQKGRWLPGAPSRARDCRLSGVVTPRRQNVTGGGSRAAAGRANRRSTDVAQWREFVFHQSPKASQNGYPHVIRDVTCYSNYPESG